MMELPAEWVHDQFVMSRFLNVRLSKISIITMTLAYANIRLKYALLVRFQGLLGQRSYYVYGWWLKEACRANRSSINNT